MQQGEAPDYPVPGIFSLTRVLIGRGVRHDTIGPTMDRATSRSRLGVLTLSVRGFGATPEGVVRESAALGRDAERAPAGVPTLGAADAGSDGPDGISEAFK